MTTQDLNIHELAALLNRIDTESMDDDQLTVYHTMLRLECNAVQRELRKRNKNDEDKMS